MGLDGFKGWQRPLTQVPWTTQVLLEFLTFSCCFPAMGTRKHARITPTACFARRLHEDTFLNEGRHGSQRRRVTRSVFGSADYYIEQKSPPPSPPPAFPWPSTKRTELEWRSTVRAGRSIGHVPGHCIVHVQQHLLRGIPKPERVLHEPSQEGWRHSQQGSFSRRISQHEATEVERAVLCGGGGGGGILYICARHLPYPFAGDAGAFEISLQPCHEIPTRHGV